MIGYRVMMAALLLGVTISMGVFAADKIQVVNEGGIGEAWALPSGTRLAVPLYPAQYAEQKAEVCVAVGFLLNEDGTTSDFSLLKSWSALEPKRGSDEYWAAFAGAAAEALAQWRFVPKPGIETPKPIYTAATFLFSPNDPQQLRKRCVIPQLAERIFELRQDGRARRHMAKNDIFKQLELDPVLEERNRIGERGKQSVAEMRDRLGRVPSQVPAPKPGGR